MVQALALATDATQSFGRTLLAEVLPADLMGPANGYFTVSIGVGTVLGFGLGSLSLVSWGALAFFGTNARALYTIAAILLTITTITTLALTHEPQFRPKNNNNKVCQCGMVFPPPKQVAHRWTNGPLKSRRRRRTVMTRAKRSSLRRRCRWDRSTRRCGRA
jgi:MFS family permease